jgi:DNA-binding transcriptional LysR family regulator
LTVAKAPQTSINIFPLGCADQTVAVSQGDIAAGLVHHAPNGPARKGFRQVIVHSEPAHALLPSTHPLAAQESVSLTELATVPLLLPAASGAFCLRQWELTEFDRHGLTPRLGREVSSIELAVATVASSGGYALG